MESFLRKESLGALGGRFPSLSVWVCSTLVSASVSYGQQNPQFSQYLMNPFVINPAITGVEDYVDLSVAYRDQWSGIEGSPKTATFSLNGSLHLLKGRLQRKEGESHQGVGAFVYTDETGPVKQGGFYGSYAYHLKVSRDWFISLGTFIGASQFRYDDSEAVLVQNPSDMLVRGFSSTHFDLNLGIYVYSNYLFLGLAANQIFDRPIPYDIDNGILTTDGRLNRNYNLLIGSRIRAGRAWEVVPSALFKSVAESPIQWDANVKVVYDNRFWLGFSYRNEDALVGILGLRIGNRLTASYSYDWTQSDFSGIQSGTHELILGYRFDFGNQSCNCPKYSL